MHARIRVFQQVLRNRRLRRVELAFLGFGTAEYGVWVSILVYAYQHGGTAMAGAVAVIQLLPAIVVAPTAARLTERRDPAIGLRISYLAQAVALLFTAIAFLSGMPSLIGYLGAVVAASMVSLTRPAQGALLPQLVETPRELTAANAVSGWVESLSMLTGPAIAGSLIATHGPGLAVLAFAVILLLCWLMLGRLAGDPRAASAAGPGPPGERDGSRALRRDRGILAVFGLFLIQFMAVGAVDVLVVVLAVKSLAIGGAGAGYLQAMFGVGSVIGAVCTVALVGRRDTVAPMLFAVSVWGLAFIALAAWRTVGSAFAIIAVAGVTRTVFDVSGRTLLHRTVPDEIHSRVFGLVEGVAMAGLALGSLSVPLLVGAGGVGAGLIGVGALLILAPVLLLGVLRGLDALPPPPFKELSLLRRCSLFRILPAPVLEDLARAVAPRLVQAGVAVMRQGDHGDDFLIVDSGTLDVYVDDRRIRTLGPGDGFGEIALLRDGQRTATVVARTRVELLSLGRAAFLEAVTGSRQAHREAEALVSARLEPGAA